MSDFWHVVEADPNPTPGVPSRLCLIGPCTDMDHCDIPVEQHVLVSSREIMKPLLYAEIRKRARPFHWQVRIMRRNEMGDSYARTSWQDAFTRVQAEKWATIEIERLSRPQAPPDIFIPEEITT